jgi:nucleoside-diphosphate-sugar epimerase
VRLLRAMGRPVTLLVRRPGLLADDLRDGSVRIWKGDAADPKALAAAFAGATTVLHLATAAGDDEAAVETFMAAAVRAAAEAALAAKVKRLVYASSTAAQWLGGPKAIDGTAPPDPRPSARAPYAASQDRGRTRARASARAGLEVTIVRPAIVVGNDGSFAHSGIGSGCATTTASAGGRGAHPLPLVLVDDCAAGLVAALDAKAAGGRHYNLAGDVRLSARAYVAEMASRTGRAYRFHATLLWWMWLQEAGKYLVKVMAGRARQWPSCAT